MSLILNALRKSEKERQSLQGKNLGTDQTQAPERYNKKKLVIYSVTFIIANLILTLVVINFIRKPQNPPKLEVKLNTDTTLQNQLNKPIEQANNVDNTDNLPAEATDNPSIADLIEESTSQSSEPSTPITVTTKPEVLKTVPENKQIKPVNKTLVVHKPTTGSKSANKTSATANLTKDKAVKTREQTQTPKVVTAKTGVTNTPAQNKSIKTATTSKLANKTTTNVAPTPDKPSDAENSAKIATVKPEPIQIPVAEPEKNKKPQTVIFESPADLTSLKQIDDLIQENRR